MVNPSPWKAQELLARCLQHETDHLNGILFIDRLPENERKLAMREIRESEWFGLAVENGSSPQIKVSPHSNRETGL
jgi:peptide deformylase